jgi:RimJ/RimL family protein N-acetyltransferase
VGHRGESRRVVPPVGEVPSPGDLSWDRGFGAGSGLDGRSRYLAPVSELPFPAPPLHDETVTLRGWCELDVEALATAGTDELIRRFRGSQPSNEAEASVWLADVEPARLRGDRLELAIADAATGELLGSITLWSVSVNHRSGLVNYWVRREARGRGIAVRAVRMLASWCFDRLDLARLQLFVDPENVGSQRVAERCGFLREGLLRSHLEIAGRRHDSLVYGLLPGEQR